VCLGAFIEGREIERLKQRRLQHRDDLLLHAAGASQKARAQRAVTLDEQGESAAERVFVEITLDGDGGGPRRALAARLVGSLEASLHCGQTKTLVGGGLAWKNRARLACGSFERASEGVLQRRKPSMSIEGERAEGFSYGPELSAHVIEHFERA